MVDVGSKRIFCLLRSSVSSLTHVGSSRQSTSFINKTLRTECLFCYFLNPSLRPLRVWVILESNKALKATLYTFLSRTIDPCRPPTMKFYTSLAMAVLSVSAVSATQDPPMRARQGILPRSAEPLASEQSPRCHAEGGFSAFTKLTLFPDPIAEAAPFLQGHASQGMLDFLSRVGSGANDLRYAMKRRKGKYSEGYSSQAKGGGYRR